MYVFPLQWKSCGSLKRMQMQSEGSEPSFIYCPYPKDATLQEKNRSRLDSPLAMHLSARETLDWLYPSFSP